MDKDIDLEKIAVLIDADNAQLTKLKLVMDEISAYGRIVVKKAYGDWNSSVLKNWEPVLKELAIKPEQQFAYTVGKNATDIALVIDAMDLLATKLYDAFAVVSSDSDYTPLVIRMRESGVYVFGAGGVNTPQPFINACDNFIKTNLLDDNFAAVSTSTASSKSQNNAASPKVVENLDIKPIHRLLSIASEKYQDDDGWTNISPAGTYIKRVLPDFESKSYGYSKLSTLIKAFPHIYEIKQLKRNTKAPIVVYKLKSTSHD